MDIHICPFLEQRLDTIEFLSINPELLKQMTAVTSKNPYDFESVLSASINQRIPQDKFRLCLSTLSKIGDFLKTLVDNSSVLPSFLQSMLDQVIKNFSTTPKTLLEPLGDDEIIKNECIEKIHDETQGAFT